MRGAGLLQGRPMADTLRLKDVPLVLEAHAQVHARREFLEEEKQNPEVELGVMVSDSPP